MTVTQKKLQKTMKKTLIPIFFGSPCIFETLGTFGAVEYCRAGAASLKPCDSASCQLKNSLLVRINISDMSVYFDACPKKQPTH